MKTPGLEIFKMCSAIFVSSKFTEILENIYKISIYLRNQTCLNIEYLRKFLRYKKGADHFMKSSSDVQPHFFFTFFGMH